MWRTYDDFIRLLFEYFDRWPWWILGNRELRSETASGVECDPLTAMAATVHGRLFDVGSYLAAARALGLDNDTAHAIAAASDLAGGYNAHVRVDLIRALHLAERWAPEGRWGDRAWHESLYPHQYDRPIRHGSGWAGPASAVWIPERSRFMVESPIVVSRPRLIVRIAKPVPHVSISSGCAAIPKAASFAFSVGVSQPGCEIYYELPRAV